MAFHQAVNLNTAGQGGAPPLPPPVMGPQDQEPPSKRPRIDPLLANSLEQELERNRLADFKRSVEGTLLDRIKKHPLYAFAVNVAGSSGRGAQLDPVLLFETTEGRRCVEELVNLEQRKSQLKIRLQELLRITQRLTQELAAINMVSPQAAPLSPPPPPPPSPSPQANPIFAQNQQRITALRVSLGEMSVQQASIKEQVQSLRDARGSKVQYATALDSIQKSDGIRALSWWLMADARADVSLTTQQSMDALIAAFPIPRSAASKNSHFFDMFSADQFGAGKQAEPYFDACSKYLGLDATMLNFSTLIGDQKRYMVLSTLVRALTNAFLTDILRDAPVKPDKEWFVKAPFMSIMDYKLFSYLIMAPWNSVDMSATKTPDQSTDKILTLLLKKHSSMYRDLVANETTKMTNAIDHVFDIPAHALDAERATLKSSSKKRKNPNDTTTSFDDASLSSAPFSGGRFGGLSTSGGGGGGGGGGTPVPSYVKKLFEEKPHIRQIFPWLKYWKLYGPSEWDKSNNRRADTAMFLTCLQEALYNLTQEPNEGAGEGVASVVDFFLDNLTPGGDATLPFRIAFLKEVLVRLGRLLDNKLLTRENNPLHRRQTWYANKIMPMIEAEMLVIAATEIKAGADDDSEFQLNSACFGEVEKYLGKHFNQRIAEVESIGNHLEKECTSLTEMKQANSAPPEPPGALPTVDPPACLAKVKVELEQHKRPSPSSAVESIPEWVESYWANKQPGSSLAASHYELQWVRDFIIATQRAGESSKIEIDSGDATIRQLTEEQESLGQRIASIKNEIESIQAPPPSPLFPLFKTPAPIQQPQQPSAYPLQEALEADLLRLKTFEEQVREMLEKSNQQQERAFDLLRRSQNIIQKRADWEQAMESAFDYLAGYSDAGMYWTRNVGSADALARSPNAQARTAFAGLTRCFINTNEESTGSRGVYQQQIYYAHNMRHAGDYARALLQLNPEQASMNGFVHTNLW